MQQRYSIGISCVLHPVGKAVREVFSGVGFGIVPQRRGGSFCTKELFMLCGESPRPIEKMSKFVERRAGLRDVKGFLAVVGGSNAAHVQFLAEAAHVAKLHSSHFLLIVAGVSAGDAPAVHAAALHGKALLPRHPKPLVVIVRQLLVLRGIVRGPVAGGSSRLHRA